MTSVPSFLMEIPTSKITDGVSIGLNSTRSEGTPYLMADPSDFTNEGMHKTICDRITFTFVYG
ncbi:MAG: hypothetical protein M1477_00525 [Candidatus Thermoplasmatota archaeon]|jgi:hypothetical protein|nr:hypothetical protein [Candidatus Thermoplasmatota archaeon]MCL5989642.1 hypothetical protein [Candidatus Thermoplasmatota archaeon]